MGLLQAFMLTNSVRVPEEIALIGYDDIAFATAAVVPISSIRQPSELMGRTAVEIVEREAGEGNAARHQNIVFQPELVARASTRRQGITPGNRPSRS